MYWKTFAGHCIHHEDNIKVHQNMMFRWLTFDSPALQTLINRHHPHRIELAYVRALTFATRSLPGPSCILGLGGGGIAHALSAITPNIPLVAVENNAQVIQIASSFFMTERLKNLTILHQDAYNFVQGYHATRYQHVFVDLFQEDAFPAHCNTTVFFEHCQRMLSPQGILAINMVNTQEHALVFEHLRQYFENRTLLIPVQGASNLIVLAYQHDSINPLLDIVKRDKRLKKLTWSPQWGCIAIL